jgi:hypothetical protein
MTQYKCICGHWWSDVAVPSDGYPNEGWVLRDQDCQPYFDKVSERIVSFIQAERTGRRTEWLVRYFRISDGDADAYTEDADVVQVILLKERKDLFIYQCENCGRLWLQETPSGQNFRSFAPDGEWKDSLTALGGSNAEVTLSRHLNRLREARRSSKRERHD